MEQFGAGQTIDITIKKQVKMYFEIDKEGKTEQEKELLTKTEFDMNTIKMKVIACVKGYEDVQFESNEYTNIISNRITSKNLDLNIETGSKFGIPGAEYKFGVNIKTGGELPIKKMATVKWKVPDELEFKEATGEYNYDENTRTVTWTLNPIKPYTIFNVVSKVKKLSNGVYHKDIILEMEGEIEGVSEKSKSNQVVVTVDIIAKAEITQTSNIAGKYIKSGEEITYTIDVKNPGMMENNVVFYDKLPEDLEFIKGSILQNREVSSIHVVNDNEIRKSLILKGNDKVTVSITAKAKNTEYNKEITHQAYIYNSSEDTKANAIKHTILGVKGEKPDDGDNNNEKPNDKYTYSVSGIAWLDENKDGKRDDTEKKIAGIKTYLLNSKDNNVLQTTLTDNNGAYSFANVQVRKLYSSF